jgi:transcriptional regulator with XRE-family HTH domain
VETGDKGRLGSLGICVRLREARQARGMTLEALAGLADMTGPAISYLERGLKVPRADTIERLARALRVSRCWLAFGDGHKPDFGSGGKVCGKCGHAE